MLINMIYLFETLFLFIINFKSNNLNSLIYSNKLENFSLA